LHVFISSLGKKYFRISFDDLALPRGEIAYVDTISKSREVEIYRRLSRRIMLYFFLIFFYNVSGIYQMNLRSPDPTNILCLIKGWLLKASYQEEEQVRIVTI